MTITTIGHAKAQDCFNLSVPSPATPQTGIKPSYDYRMLNNNAVTLHEILLPQSSFHHFPDHLPWHLWLPQPSLNWTTQNLATHFKEIYWCVGYVLKCSQASAYCQGNTAPVTSILVKANWQPCHCNFQKYFPTARLSSQPLFSSVQYFIT